MKINACSARHRPVSGSSISPSRPKSTRHPGLAVRDPQRRLPPAEAALLGREAVQRPVGNIDAAAGELAVDVGQLQIRIYPGGDLRLPRRQVLPRLAVPGRPRGTDRRNNVSIEPDHAS